MSFFDRLDRMVSRTVDRQFSVSAIITPVMRTPNGRAAPDATQIRQGDRLALDDARIFQVSSVQPDGLSRSVLILSKWQSAA